jgi:hypothetical protein
MIGAALALAGNPAARLVTAAVVGFVVCAGVYTAGYRAAATGCRAEQYKTERDAALRDLAIAEKSNEDAERLASESDKLAAELQKKVESYARGLKKNGSCDLTDDDIKRLRAIR